MRINPEVPLETTCDAYYEPSRHNPDTKRQRAIAKRRETARVREGHPETSAGNSVLKSRPLANNTILDARGPIGLP